MNSKLATLGSRIPAQTPRGLECVKRIEEAILEQDQLALTTWHVIHAGVYSRTICIPQGAALTGALIKIPTTLTITGHALVMLGDGEEKVIQGHQVLAASAGRKQAYIAYEDTWVTMSFCTTAKTVEEAEAEFTDEAERLLSRHNPNHVVVTGD